MLAWFKRGNIYIRNVNGLFLLVLELKTSTAQVLV